jgi:hypothetical protein
VLRTPRQVLYLQFDAVWVTAQPTSVYESTVLRAGLHTDALRVADRGLYARHSSPAPRSIVSRAGDLADCYLSAELGLDPPNGKVRVYNRTGHYLPRLAMELPATDTEDDLGDALHAVVHA